MIATGVARAPAPSLRFEAVRGRADEWPGRALAVLFAIAVAAMPLLRPSGPGNTSPVDVAVLVSVVGLLASASRRGVRLRAPFFYSWSLLIVAGCVSTIAGGILLGNDQQIGFPVVAAVAVIQDLYLLIWTIALANACRDAGTLRLVLATWAISAAGWAALMTAGVVLNIHALSGIEPGFGVRAEFTFGDPNMASNYFAMSVMVLWAARQPASRAVRLGVLALLLVGMVLTGSNGGVLNLAISASVALLITGIRRFGLARMLVIAIATGAAGVAITTLVPPDAIQQAARNSGQPILRDWIGRSNQSAEQRIVILQEASTLAAEGGPLGYGPGSTKPLLDQTQANYVHAAHDDYVASTVERGALGALGLLLMMGAIAVRCFGVVQRPLRTAFTRVVNPVPLVGAVCGLAVAATYYQVLHFRHVWALLAIIAAIYVWGVRRLEPVT